MEQSRNFSIQGFYPLRIIALGFIATILISIKLWFPILRAFPVNGSINLHDAELVITILSTILLGCLTVLFVGGFRVQKYKVIEFTSVLIILLILFDTLLLQPWVFYFFTFLVVQLIGDKEKKSTYIVLILSFIYLMSGLQKLNASFIIDTAPSFLSQLPLIKLHKLFPSYAFLLIGISEAIFGILLLFNQSRKAAIYCLLMMHLVIIYCLGPWQGELNNVIIPWNLTFALLLISIFECETRFDSEFRRSNLKSAIMVVIVFLILPLFSFLNLYPKFLSGALYSGNKLEGHIYVSDDFRTRVLSKVDGVSISYENKLNLNNWTLNEMHVPIFPSEDYVKGVYQKLCSKSEHEFDVILEINYEPNSIFSTKREQKNLFCDEL